MPINKSKDLKTLLLILVIFAIILICFRRDQEFSNEDNFNYENIKISGISGKIHVNNNWSATEAAGICTGQGTLADPYVIRDFIIDVGGPENGIYIENTNEYFEIINCSIFNSERCSGIRLSYVENGIIENNNCSYNNRGIGIAYSSKIMVINNTLYENGFGIEIDISNEITLIKNNCSKCYQAVYLYFSSDCTLNENFCRDSEFGIQLYYSSRITLLENLMENCGIVCDGSKTAVSSYNIDETNLVNGKPVRYYSSQTSIYVPLNAGQVIMANCTLSTIENQNINNTTDAIEILHCSNITISG
ncbi:MAG: right-handed parallel beta-helix repeat-containing protein, partial [Promethearchaeota archaeon]